MIPAQVKPILDAIASGIPLGKMKPNEACPTLPQIPTMVVIDDASGGGPSSFDATALFDQIDSVVIVTPQTFGAGASALAARARAGDRAALVQTIPEAFAQWLALVSERRNLAKNFLLLGADDVIPEDAKLILRDIAAIASAPTN